jgi:hypothetical protein
LFTWQEVTETPASRSNQVKRSERELEKSGDFEEGTHEENFDVVGDFEPASGAGCSAAGAIHDDDAAHGEHPVRIRSRHTNAAGWGLRG